MRSSSSSQTALVRANQARAICLPNMYGVFNLATSREQTNENQDAVRFANKQHGGTWGKLHNKERKKYARGHDIVIKLKNRHW